MLMRWGSGGLPKSQLHKDLHVKQFACLSAPKIVMSTAHTHLSTSLRHSVRRSQGNRRLQSCWFGLFSGLQGIITPHVCVGAGVWGQHRLHPEAYLSNPSWEYPFLRPSPSCCLGLNRVLPEKVTCICVLTSGTWDTYTFFLVLS